MNVDNMVAFLIFRGGEILKIYSGYRLYISYTLFGIITGAVDILTYTLCILYTNLDVVRSNVIAWILSALTAYITNRKWVFKSENGTARSVVREIVSFFGCRALTLVLGTFIIAAGVHWFYQGEIIMKYISTVFVIIVNYIASRLIIFRKRT